METVLITAAAGIVAAVIAATIALVNLIAAKETKTSEFRQLWINALRDELAEFQGAARQFARLSDHDLKVKAGLSQDLNIAPFSKDASGTARSTAATKLAQIAMRLNPSEHEHVRLLRLLRAAVASQNRTLRKNKFDRATVSLTLGDPNGMDRTLDRLNKALMLSQKVLKEEWEVVKRGEKPFIQAKRIAIRILIGAASLAAAVALVVGGYYALKEPPRSFSASSSGR